MSAPERADVVLGSVPKLGPLYAAAAGKQAAGWRRRRAVRGRGPGAPEEVLRLPAVRHVVRGVAADPGRLAAYQRLVGDALRDTLPSVYVHGLAFPVAVGVMVRADFPLPLLGMVHLGNVVEHSRPIGVGEELEIAAWPENLRAHRAGTRVDMVVEASAGGVPVWRGVSTYLAKGIGAAPELAPGEPRACLPPAPTARWQLDAATGRAYAAVLGDYNPIHLGVLPAKALGLKRPIAHGMYLAGRVLATAAPNDCGYRWSIRFEAPVFLPGTVEVALGPHNGTVDFEGWNAASGRRHFAGRVGALPPAET
ncbi:acyl dehydratase [Zafaria cholistanensis]|uniref:Acyl dehydratase n=1 Tax=Zafaria cholistanensis TaxID=1682741 RepID=A0A5A7NPI5_9MICC|nr:MaoC/PaaZ C-terminal domain-containing protein [Zafaria cholistanensis]GER22072.1 acyl dehydratase [Zafaria cholistanensis]